MIAGTAGIGLGYAVDVVGYRLLGFVGGHDGGTSDADFGVGRECVFDAFGAQESGVDAAFAA